MKSIIISIIIGVMVLLAGCSSDIPDCSSQNTQYTIYTYNETQEQCVISQQLEQGVCGNGINEEGETFCNCEEDVSQTAPLEQGGCSGDKGDFLSYQCSESTNTCELEVTDKVKRDSKLLEFSRGADYSLNAEVYYNTPFMTDRHTVDVELLLKNFQNDENIKIKDFTIVKAYIVSQQDELLASKTINKEMTSKFETYDFSMDIDNFSFETFNKNVRNVYLKFLITYTKERYSDGSLYRSESQDSEVQSIFSNNFQLINPANKNEEVETTSSWS